MATFDRSRVSHSITWFETPCVNDSLTANKTHYSSAVESPITTPKSRVNVELDAFSDPARRFLDTIALQCRENGDVGVFDHLSVEFLVEFNVFLPAEEQTREH